MSHRRAPVDGVSRLRRVWPAVCGLAVLALLGACGGGSDRRAGPAESSSAGANESLPGDLCDALAPALAETPDLAVDASGATPSTRADSTVVCNLAGTTLDLQVSATAARAGTADAAAADLRAACALLASTTGGSFSRSTDTCSSTAGRTAPGMVTSVSTLVQPHALLVVQATSTSESGPILAAKISELLLHLAVGGSTLSD